MNIFAGFLCTVDLNNGLEAILIGTYYYTTGAFVVISSWVILSSLVLLVCSCSLMISLFLLLLTDFGMLVLCFFGRELNENLNS